MAFVRGPSIDPAEFAAVRPHGLNLRIDIESCDIDALDINLGGW